MIKHTKKESCAMTEHIREIASAPETAETEEKKNADPDIFLSGSAMNFYRSDV